jgi:argininosuccinate lyase
MASFDLRSNLKSVADKAEARLQHDERTSWYPNARWRALLLVHAAHARQLLRAGIVDDQGFRAIARALDATLQAAADESQPLSAALVTVDERVNALLPQEFAGAASLGLSRVETGATALRIVWRDGGLAAHDATLTLRDALLNLAEAHAVTIMAAVWGGRPASPTTLAHFLGGAIGPLDIASVRLRQGIELLNRSPMGAGVLAGDVLEAERDDLATGLGFDGPIANTLDALGSIEDVVSLIEGTGAALAATRRLVAELLAWIRTDPTSFFLDASWEEFPEPSMPALAVGARLERLLIELQAAEAAGRTVVDVLRSTPYGPLGAAWDPVAEMMADALGKATAALGGATDAVNEALIVNRAYLANRAGRDYTTASDLVPFLMTEESLPPSAARQIASLVVSRLREQHLEASAVTQDMIDSAALMVIGRELKVEMETLGRYLAPRRFIERRNVLGSPAPERTRAWLRDERKRLADDRAWEDAQRDRWNAALDAIQTSIATAAIETDD